MSFYISSMIAKIIKPGYPLSGFIDSVYCYSGASQGITQHLIPDGKTDLLLNFGTAIYILDDKKEKQVITESIFQGIRKRPYTFEFGKRLNIIGIRFHPLGFSSLFKYREKDITENPVNAELIAGNTIKEIEDRISAEPDVNKKLAIVEKWLYEFFIRRDESNIRVSDALVELNSSKGVLKIKDIVDGEAGYKRIQRTFSEYIGISPKLYSRMIRFENLHEDLRRLSKVDWIDIVSKYDFHDQSHLIKEFRFFTGTTPSDFISKLDIYI